MKRYRPALAVANAKYLPLPDESVDLSVQSPPYANKVRNYGAGEGEIGREDGIDCWSWATGSERCGVCYMCAMRAVLEEMWRVLRPTGLAFFVLDDGYARGAAGFRAKEMLLVPERFGLMAQRMGWIVRAKPIWWKRNAKPEGKLRDRPARDYEPIYMLAKGDDYTWNIEAGRREPAAYTRKGGTAAYTANGATNNGVGSKSFHQMAPNGALMRTVLFDEVWHEVLDIPTVASGGLHYAPFPPALAAKLIQIASNPGDLVIDVFAGTGTTCVEAARLDRRAAGFDLSPLFLREDAAARIDRAFGPVEAEMALIADWSAGRAIPGGGEFVDLPLFATPG